MSQEGLADALEAIQAARSALEDDDLPRALLNLCHANRYHAVSIALRSVGAVALGRTSDEDRASANESEVGAKLAILRDEIAAFAAPKRPRNAAVVDVMSEALAPILRELKVPGAEPVAVVEARARNAAAIMLGTFDVRERHDR